MHQLTLLQIPICSRASTLTQRGCKLSVMLDLGSRVTFSGVLGVLLSRYLRTMETRATLASYKANLIAMQLLGPCPNARKVYLQFEHKHCCMQPTKGSTRRLFGSVYPMSCTGNKITSWRRLRVFRTATARKSTQPPPGG